MDIDKRLKEIEKEHSLIMNRKDELEEEYNSYFYRISLCNSSDHYNTFIKENPDWKYKNNVTFSKPLHEGYLKDVYLRILKHKISKEDFLVEARKIVSPHVGDDDFFNFNYKY